MKPILLMLAAFGVSMSQVDDILAQQLVSPDVQPDGSVIFRVRIPNANSVTVTGIHGVPDTAMSKGKENIWSAKIGPLDPERYSYTFNVDGATWVDPHNRDLKAWLSCASQFEIAGKPPLLHEQTRVPHGTVAHHIYDSSVADHERGVFVYTPPGYEETKADFPVLYLLHGFGDDESAWLKVGRANFIVDNLIAQKKVRPFVMVMPYGHPLPIDLREKFDDYSARNIKLMEADLLQELIPIVQKRYRLTEDRIQTAITGLSMGGGQSLTIGLRHLKQFAHVGGFSSATPDGDTALPGLALSETDANTQIETLWIACGKDDFLLKRNHAFIGWLQKNQIKHEYVETDGGHDWMVWRKYLATFAQLAFQPK